MNNLSIKQLQVLEAIEYFTNKNGYPPTNRELATLLKCDVNTIFKKLMILEEKGYIKTEHGKARSIRVIKDETIS